MGVDATKIDRFGHAIQSPSNNLELGTIKSLVQKSTRSVGRVEALRGPPGISICLAGLAKPRPALHVPLMTHRQARRLPYGPRKASTRPTRFADDPPASETLALRASQSLDPPYTFR